MSKNYFKKTLAGIFAVALVASSIPLAPYTKVLDSISITASAADYFYFDVNDDGTLTITGYDGTGGDVVIPSTIDGASVTSIGASAFIYCDNLSKVSIPASVTSIGNSAFDWCTNLSEVTIPDSVKSIGEEAFCYCEALTEIKIPDSVTNIGVSAFEECHFLTSVTIGNSVTSIGEWTFFNCGCLTEITIPDSVTSIGANAFKDCDELENVYYTGSKSDWKSVSIDDGNDVLTNATITYGKAAQKILDSELTWEIDENGVLTISGDDEAFPECWVNDAAVEWCDKKDEVTEVVFNTPKLTKLGSAAFYGFKNLTSVKLPDTLTSIGNKAFYDCKQMTSITIPDSVISIGDFAFFRCSALTEITIPASVTSIGNRAFYECAGLTSVTIGNSVTSIGNYAFYECAGLTSVTIGNSVTSIGDYAFCWCESLSEVTIPDSVTSIGDRAFCNCSALKNVYYTGSKSDWESVSIDDGNDVLTNATITYVKAAQKILDSELTWEIDENGVLTISGDDEAFPECVVNNALVEWCDKKDEVKEIVFATPKLKNLSSAALYDFENLTSVKLPETLTSIGYVAFGNCSALTQIVIPDTVTSIGDDAFDGCSALTEIKIPDSVTSIGDSAFFECTALKEVKIPDYVTSISDMAFYGCGSLTEIKISNSVTSIGRGAFGECSALTEIKIPGSVTSIGDSAFCLCSALTEITIPDSVTSIGDEAFWNCSALTEVTFECDDADAIEKFNSQGNSDIFDQSALETIYVPAGCVDSYKNSDGYKAALGDYIDLIQEKSTVEAMGASVSYNGDVTINFHYLVSDSYKNGYVKFGDDLVVNVSEASIDKDGYYVFPISMPAKNMYDEITAQFYDENHAAVGEKVEFTLTGYMKEVKEYDPNYSDFVDSFLEYGAQAAAYFGVSGAPAGKSYTKDDYNKISEALAAYATVDMDEHFVGATLLLKSVPKLRLYYDNDTAVENLEASDNNPGLYYVEQEFKPSDFRGDLNGYSVYNYIYKALQTGSDELKPLCAALYNLSSQFN